MYFEIKYNLYFTKICSSKENKKLGHVFKNDLHSSKMYVALSYVTDMFDYNNISCM